MPLDVVSQLITEYRYWILIPLAFAEGPIVGLNAGILASFGVFNLFAVFIVLIIRDIAMDAIMYALGHYGNRGKMIERYSAKIGIKKEHWDVIERLWHKHPGKTMFLSKFAYGLSAAFLISAGMTRISYRKFWYHAIQVSLLQYGSLVLLGYFFGNSYDLISTSFKGLELIMLGALVLSIGFIFFSKHMRKKLLQAEKEEESKTTSLS